MTGVLLTKQDGSELEIDSLQYIFAEAVKTGTYKSPVVDWENEDSNFFEADGREQTIVHLTDGTEVAVRETPEEINEQLPALLLTRENGAACSVNPLHCLFAEAAKAVADKIVSDWTVDVGGDKAGARLYLTGNTDLRVKESADYVTQALKDLRKPSL